MLNDKIKGVLIGLLVGSTVAGGLVFAKSGTESIEAVYDNIKIVVDGEEIQPKDANGQPVEPFIYNGTTYLPVRSVGMAMGKDVNWDGVEKVVYLGSKPGSTESWLDVCGPYQYSHGEEYRLIDNKYFNMSGKKYTNGFVLNDIGRYSHGARWALFNLNGKYKSLTVTVGHIDNARAENATLNIYLDGIIAYTKELKYDDVARPITIPLNNALQMKLEVNGHGGLTSYGFSEGKFE